MTIGLRMATLASDMNTLLDEGQFGNAGGMKSSDPGLPGCGADAPALHR